VADRAVTERYGHFRPGRKILPVLASQQTSADACGTCATMPLLNVTISTRDLELLEQTCRELADRYGRDSQMAQGQATQGIFRESQQRFERLADWMKTVREVPP
jgi:hypothetical protein